MCRTNASTQMRSYVLPWIQKDPGIPNVHMMLGRRLIGEILFGHADDHGIELHPRPARVQAIDGRATSPAIRLRDLGSDLVSVRATKASDATIS